MFPWPNGKGGWMACLQLLILTTLDHKNLNKPIVWLCQRCYHKPNRSKPQKDYFSFRKHSFTTKGFLHFRLNATDFILTPASIKQRLIFSTWRLWPTSPRPWGWDERLSRPTFQPFSSTSAWPKSRAGSRPRPDGLAKRPPGWPRRARTRRRSKRLKFASEW